MAHVLGTDTQGYDVLSRLMYGARTTLFIGFAVVFVAGTFGIVLGLIAGYKGGRTDRWLMRWVDVQVAFPGLLIALIMIAVLGPSMGSLIFVLAFNGWMVYARMTRGIVLSAKERPYVEAAEMIGCKPRRVMFKHILPNLTSALLTLAVLEFARIILAEATLSFLGLGMQFPEVSLGVMANSGRDAFFSLPRLAIIPGVAITLIVLAVNFLAVLAARRPRPDRAGEALRRRVGVVSRLGDRPHGRSMSRSWARRPSSRSTTSRSTSSPGAAPCTPSATSASRSARARRSGWSASPARARASPPRRCSA